MTTLTVFLPEMIAFPLRIGANQALLDAIRPEPLIFAAHYAAVGSLFDWPDDIQDIVNAVRERYAKHDELLELMERLRPQVGFISLSPERAKQLAEGLDVFTRLSILPAVS